MRNIRSSGRQPHDTTALSPLKTHDQQLCLWPAHMGWLHHKCNRLRLHCK